MATASDALRVAAAEIGYNRFNDPAEGTKYGRDYATRHGAYYGTSGVPYCAIFATWVLRHVGITPPGGDFAYVPYGINAARAANRLVTKAGAQPGDLVCFDWNGDGVADHVGFVELNRGTYYQTIEGNTSPGTAGSQGNGGGVYRRTRDLSCVIAVIRPEYSGAAPAVQPSKPAQTGLAVDGYWGAATTRALQKVLGTPVDGVVSSQSSAWKASNPGLTGGWEWVSAPKGSQVIAALQKKLGVTDDGLIGPNTIKALQKRMGTTQDGVLSKESTCITALQKRLQKGTI